MGPTPGKSLTSFCFTSFRVSPINQWNRPQHLELPVEAHTWHMHMQIFSTHVHVYSCVTPQGGVRVRDWWWRRRQRYKTKGRGADELPDGRPVMDFTTAAACSWIAAFSPPFFPLIRLLPDSLCRHHWRLYLSFVLRHSAVAVRFILTLPVASLQFSVPFRRLRRRMTCAIVLMKVRICFLPDPSPSTLSITSPPLVCARLQ